MSTHVHHCYHMVEVSPWPLIASSGAGLLALGLIIVISSGKGVVLNLGLGCLLLTASQWWRDVSREASYQGCHTSSVQWNMRWGMILFIASEVLFFFSFFWAYYNSSLAPGLELGLVWPPVGIESFNPFGIPLLNTTILLSSGLTVTWSHHALMNGDHYQSSAALWLTIGLGVYFTAIQAYEYLQASFSFADSVYGSCFFMATGFHGAHVLIGTMLLSVMLLRLGMGQLSPAHHFGFEAAAWYWHFVDVVWIFLFMSIYWWGS